MKKLMLFLIVIVMILLMGMGAAELSERLHGDRAPSYSTVSGPASASAVPELPAPVKEQDWRLRIVSEAQPLPEDFTVETEEAENCYLFDTRAAQALRDFLAAGRAAGMDLEVASAWRDWATQETLFENKVSRVMAETGLGREEAGEIAADEVARPGTSEHQLGLAVDIISNDYPWLDEGWADTEEAAWLEAHCAEYGFILRYPPDKSELTGIVWEPWHFRYVGKEAAVYIMENGLCLEEYAAGQAQIKLKEISKRAPLHPAAGRGFTSPPRNTTRAAARPARSGPPTRRRASSKSSRLTSPRRRSRAMRRATSGSPPSAPCPRAGCWCLRPQGA